MPITAASSVNGAEALPLLCVHARVPAAHGLVVVRARVDELVLDRLFVGKDREIRDVHAHQAEAVAQLGNAGRQIPAQILGDDLDIRRDARDELRPSVFVEQEIPAPGREARGIRIPPALLLMFGMFRKHALSKRIEEGLLQRKF